MARSPQDFWGPTSMDRRWIWGAPHPALAGGRREPAPGLSGGPAPACRPVWRRHCPPYHRGMSREINGLRHAHQHQPHLYPHFCGALRGLPSPSWER